MVSPVIRCIKEQLKSALHFVTKDKYVDVIRSNPHIDKIYTFQHSYTEIKHDLFNERYSIVIDLHQTLRSFRLRQSLKAPVISFKKEGFQKWQYLKFRQNRLSQKHLIDRFFDGLKSIKVNNDGRGMEIFIDDDANAKVDAILNNLDIKRRYTAIVIGAAHYTKQIPVELCIDFINKSKEPIILLGGSDDTAKALQIAEYSNRYVNNMVGKFNIQESAAFIRESKLVITGDTGLMHIAASFGRPTLVVYGSTSPVFGMYPYYGDKASKVEILSSEGLNCWPCSRSGRKECPKAHFKCMKDWTGNDLIIRALKLEIRN